MIDFEIDKIRKHIKAMNPYLDFDSCYTFYYDETNNLKTFYIKETDFNYSFQANFVLGGVLYENEKPDIENIFQGLDLQPNIKEVKFKHIAHGGLQDCLKSQRLNILLKRIINTPLYVHYTSVNFLYWSIVDIVDSAIVNSPTAKQLGSSFANHLKNDLYFLCKYELDDVISIFHHFNYPNLEKKDISEFIKNLSSLFEEYEKDVRFHIGLTSLKQILKESEKNEELPFIMGNKDHILLENFTHFYLAPLYKFKNSKHIFDNEFSIQESLQEYRLLDKGVVYNNFLFEDSQNDLFIQLSDVVVGIIGKMTHFVNTHTCDEILYEISKFSDLQLNNLDLYLDIITKSHNKNMAFLHNVDSFEEINKMDVICKARNKG